MRALTAGWVFPASAVFMMLTVVACEGQIQPRQETDAELYCRQAGFNYFSTAFEDCLAAHGPIRRRVKKR